MQSSFRPEADKRKETRDKRASSTPSSRVAWLDKFAGPATVPVLERCTHWEGCHVLSSAKGVLGRIVVVYAVCLFITRPE